ncbi:UDP-glycosyltransferase UGT5-like isoform X1 [Plodia interpunctella]|uniref:UDP-glycosyltransferase UGT5-like isoform X1 n=1 Tax=Plodia interpunctella TaxID=58824 RepID=UPI0023682F8D|nr:UDP-glycosyltransferase UGT5-like isoform X1 [Plodia interpunctella]
MLRVLVIFCCVLGLEAARILFVIPTPSISHQLPMRPLTQELAKRGHDVVVVTTDPIYPKGGAPANFTEIDLHDISYKIWRDKVLNEITSSGSANDLDYQMYMMSLLIVEIFEVQMLTEPVQTLINDKTQKFDLMFLESVSKPAILFSHVFKAPVILISSFLSIYNNLQVIGGEVHYILYPEITTQKINDVTKWDKLKEFYNQYKFVKMLDSLEERQNEAMRKVAGPDIPPLMELFNKVDMLFLNAHPIWDSNRPVPPNVVYLGGIHKIPPKDLPKDLKAYLDTSKNGVIYISFGTNVSPSALPAEKIQILAKVFSRLPYDVLWKWDKDELPGKPANVRISHWLPQSDLLRHPKLKLFVTQGGLQSTDEAIDAGVPLIGIPMLGDQWFNVENYVKHGIGVRLDMDTLTEEKFQDAIDKVIKDPSYRQNIAKLRDLINDQPQTPLERAVWWTEHILRHGGGRHLRSPAANIHWTQYYEVELISYLLFGLLAVLALSGAVIFYTVRHISLLINKNSKLKTN